MSRVPYYTKFWLKYLTKTFDDQIPDEKYFELHKSEIDYYCKIKQPVSLEKGIKVRDINLLKNSGYTYDLYTILYPFREELSFNFIPGDVTTVPEYPAFVKSRPIDGKNENSVLLPLDSQRHFRFVNDRIRYADKLDGVVWRGAAYQEHRQRFLEVLQWIELYKCRKYRRTKKWKCSFCETPNVHKRTTEIQICLVLGR